MQKQKISSTMNQMIQRCHKWRQKRKQLIDLARQQTDEIERERLLQAAEHYGRIVAETQLQIDSQRDPKDTTESAVNVVSETENIESTDEEDTELPEFITDLK